MIRNAKQPQESGKEYYRSLYRSDLARQAEWHRRTARAKVDSVERLLARNGILPRTILELGCGTGAVILECQRRNLGISYTAVDYSSEAIAHLECHSEGIETMAADITDPEFSLQGKFDVVVLSHVLEHLEEPSKFLDSALKRIAFSYLLVEVPLEDLPLQRIKNLVRDRRMNNAGHVQFYTAGSFRRFLEFHSLHIVDERKYVPILDLDTIGFVARKDGMSRLQHAIRIATGRFLPIILGPIWRKLYYAHHAVLCEAR